MNEYLTRRNGVWQFVRRVPVEFKTFDKRGIIKLSTKIRIAGDRQARKASLVAEKMNLDLEAFWRKHADGAAVQAQIDYAGAVARARALGVDYAPAQQVASEPPADLIRRLDILSVGDRQHDQRLRAALLGAVAPPRILLSRLFDEYESITRTQRLGYSEGQLRKWRAGKRRAAEILVEVIGDKAVGDLSRDNAITYRDYWQARVVKGLITAGTANKNITHVARMVRKVAQHHRLGNDTVFSGLRLEGVRHRQRKPFAAVFIRNTILRTGALDGLNDEARAAVHVLVNTGARPSEIVNLAPERIALGADVPYIQIRPVGRILKSDASSRDLPLVGIALQALQAFPNGFPRYADNESSFSATVNKYFAENGMKPSRLHSVYSLRHGLKDRLREAECPDELRDEIMGHVSGKPKYGDGHGLRLKLKYLAMIAIHPATIGEDAGSLRAAR